MKILPTSLGCLALACCGPHAPSHADGGGDGQCGAGTISEFVTFPADAGTVEIFSSCFSALQATFIAGVQVELSSDDFTLSDNSAGGTGGIVIDFAASCGFDAGQVIPLTDPCLRIYCTDNPAGVPGIANECASPAPGLGAACASVAQVANVTQGSLTLDRWGNQVGDTIQVTFSSGAVLTGAAALPPPGAVQGIPVPIAGSATAILK